jgi:hypothetical protein
MKGMVWYGGMDNWCSQILLVINFLLMVGMTWDWVLLIVLLKLFVEKHLCLNTQRFIQRMKNN